MSSGEREIRKRERAAKLMIWLADRASRNNSVLDRLCRWLVVRATRVDPAKDFMRDPLIDNDDGFDPDELDRYQRGESPAANKLSSRNPIN